MGVVGVGGVGAVGGVGGAGGAGGVPDATVLLTTIANAASDALL